MRIAVIGSRDYPRLNDVWTFVEKVALRKPDVVIVSGGARGVDTVAAASARMAGLTVEEFIPDWDRLGKLAGFARNSDIIQAADVVAVFWDGKSRGTIDSYDKALQAGKKILMLGSAR